MTINPNGSAVDSSDSVDGDQSQDNQVNVTDEQTQSDKSGAVEFSTFKRVQSDMFKYKDRMKELEHELKKKQDQDLEKNNQYKELWEKTRGRVEELEGEKESFSKFMKHDARTREVRGELLRLGIFDKELEQIDKWDLSEIPAELTESGTVRVEGAKSFAESLKKDKPYLFRDTSAPKVNSGGGRPGGAENEPELTAEYVAGLKRKNPKLYKQKLTEFAKMRAKQRAESS